MGNDRDFTEFEQAVATVLEGLGEGDVVSYGDVAADAGYPGVASSVGRFQTTYEGFPWRRVVNAAGRLVPGHEVKQTKLLRKEGVVVVNGKVAPA